LGAEYSGGSDLLKELALWMISILTSRYTLTEGEWTTLLKRLSKAILNVLSSASKDLESPPLTEIHFPEPWMFSEI
jgi:hypothetical protein